MLLENQTLYISWLTWIFCSIWSSLIRCLPWARHCQESIFLWWHMKKGDKCCGQGEHAKRGPKEWCGRAEATQVVPPQSLFPSALTHLKLIPDFESLEYFQKDTFTSTQANAKVKLSIVTGGIRALGYPGPNPSFAQPLPSLVSYLISMYFSFLIHKIQ